MAKTRDKTNECDSIELTAHLKRQDINSARHNRQNTALLKTSFSGESESEAICWRSGVFAAVISSISVVV